MAKIIDFTAARVAMGRLFSEGDTQLTDKELKEWSTTCLVLGIIFLAAACVCGGFGAVFGQGFSSKGWQVIALIFLGLWIPGITLHKRLPTAALWIGTFFALLLLLRLIFW
ncbi:MAG: hypothetical protein AAB605_03680 [Patescibacteria group bacterium]